MLDQISLTVGGYWDFYCTFLLQQWQQMNPMKYALLLTGISAVGYLLMRSGTKRL